MINDRDRDNESDVFIMIMLNWIPIGKGREMKEKKQNGELFHILKKKIQRKDMK